VSRANGYFVAFVNERAYRKTPADGALIAQVTDVARTVVQSAQVRWAGSQRKGTDVASSDLDLCVESVQPVTEAHRRALRAALEQQLGRPALVLSHAIRLPPKGDRPRVDIAFANAAFGSRPLPDVTTFHQQPGRQAAARALKLWGRATGLPSLPGWVVEAIVVHLDANPGSLLPLDLFLRVVEWLDKRANPAALEGILRPVAAPRWNPAWSEKLPGRLTALSSHAKALRRRPNRPETWSRAADVELWLLR